MPGPKLTKEQREPLFRLVDFQQEEGKLVTFRHLGRQDVRVADRVVAGGGVTRGVLELWANRGYINLTKHEPPAEVLSGHVLTGPGGVSTFWTFILTQEALEYAALMRRPAPVRLVSETFEGWRTDFRSALIVGLVTLLCFGCCTGAITIVATVFADVLSHVLLRWLQLLP